ncbi:MAG: HEAT repeat domain-containing protein [Actinomycetota bacterium]|nr:HEAT repeat domain-containing protein [Actinomycetota bacterium]
MRREKELVERLGSNDTVLDAMQALIGAAKARDLKSIELTDAAYEALIGALKHANPRVRWYCVQIFDHVSYPQAMQAVAELLEDPVPRVRRNAVHALTCEKCKPGGAYQVDSGTARKIEWLARHDPSSKVRAEAAVGLCAT